MASSDLNRQCHSQLLKLPTELISLIVSWLPQSALATLCLVSILLADIATEYLYKWPMITSEGSLRIFFNTLKKRPQLRTCVQDLALDFIEESGTRSHERQRRLRGYGKALLKLSNLRQLHSKFGPLPRDIPLKAYQDIAKFLAARQAVFTLPSDLTSGPLVPNLRFFYGPFNLATLLLPQAKTEHAIIHLPIEPRDAGNVQRWQVFAFLRSLAQGSAALGVLKIRGEWNIIEPLEIAQSAPYVKELTIDHFGMEPEDRKVFRTALINAVPAFENLIAVHVEYDPYFALEANVLATKPMGLSEEERRRIKETCPKFEDIIFYCEA
ncbi:F-box domain-containing protein [Mycena indigotica]|uniref:F-box domain-containing protein n=1 Tax=Mycena indigotica TaxID=2126181 RepID=A0A8H6VV72_9AGAR|nr:F-box domain-containing protein [Mycena indigotica]KAF7291318.1 F-box domain-containing protein [Mycena indigotica]